MSYAQDARAATLRLGQPTVENERISIAVFLEGNASEAPAAMDFRLRYDPAVVRVVGAEAGVQAQQAGKRLIANTPAAGQYVVLIMNFNQQTIAPGHVATLSLVQSSPAEAATTLVQLTAPTLSTMEGVAMPVEGSEVIVSLTQRVPDEPETDTPTGGDTPPDSGGAEPPPDTGGPGTGTPDDWMAPGGGIQVPAEEDQPVPAEQSLASALSEAERARTGVTAPVPAPPSRSSADGQLDEPETAGQRTPTLEQGAVTEGASGAVDFPAKPGQDLDRDAPEISSPDVEPGAASPVSPPDGVSLRTKRIVMGVAAGVLVMLIVLRRRLVR